MKILLVASNTRKKSVVFLTDSHKALSLDEAIASVKRGVLEGVFPVHGSYGTYLRSFPTTSEKDNLDALSLTAADIQAYINGTRRAHSTDAISIYTARYIASLQKGKGPFLKPVGDVKNLSIKVLIADVKEKLVPHRSIIKKAASEFSIDQYLLGALLIDEIARALPFEEVLDLVLLNGVGRNVSAGVAQVKLETANYFIQQGLYNPNPDDSKLPFSGNLTKEARKHLYHYVVQPKHCIRFAAAFVRHVINLWSRHIDLSKKPEIIGTLYHKGFGDPKPNPLSNERGEQIANEFYALAKKWLTETI